MSKGKQCPTRNAHGTFRRGGPGGPGRPPRPIEVEYALALQRTLTPAKLKKVIAKLVCAALEGDVRAAKVVLETAVGKPRQRIEFQDPPGSVLRWAGQSVEEVDRQMLARLAAFLPKRRKSHASPAASIPPAGAEPDTPAAADEPELDTSVSVSVSEPEPEPEPEPERKDESDGIKSNGTPRRPQSNGNGCPFFPPGYQRSNGNGKG